MKKHLTIIILSIGFLLTSCSGMKTVKGSSTVASGTEVSFEKLMNSAFARDYIDADIITEVQFHAPNKSKYWQTKIPKGHIVFQVLPIGGSPRQSPLGGETGDYVFIPKSKGDIVFELTAGDKIELRGGTRVRKGVLVGNVEFVEFLATSIKKL